jgi:hypothetical protein
MYMKVAFSLSLSLPPREAQKSCGREHRAAESIRIHKGPPNWVSLKERNLYSQNLLNFTGLQVGQPSLLA